MPNVYKKIIEPILWYILGPAWIALRTFLLLALLLPVLDKLKLSQPTSGDVLIGALFLSMLYYIYRFIRKTRRGQAQVFFVVTPLLAVLAETANIESQYVPKDYKKTIKKTSWYIFGPTWIALRTFILFGFLAPILDKLEISQSTAMVLLITGWFLPSLYYIFKFIRKTRRGEVHEFFVVSPLLHVLGEVVPVLISIIWVGFLTLIASMTLCLPLLLLDVYSPYKLYSGAATGLWCLLGAYYIFKRLKDKHGFVSDPNSVDLSRNQMGITGMSGSADYLS